MIEWPNVRLRGTKMWLICRQTFGWSNLSMFVLGVGCKHSRSIALEDRGVLVSRVRPVLKWVYSIYVFQLGIALRGCVLRRYFFKKVFLSSCVSGPSRLPRQILKLVKHRKVRGRIKHFLKKSVPVSSVLFNVATSCKQWIVKVAHKEESVLLDFLKENSNNKSVRLLEGIIHVTQNFCPSWLIIRTTSCLKRSFCYLETLN